MSILWILIISFIIFQLVLGLLVMLVARNIFWLQKEPFPYLFNPLALFRKIIFPFIDMRQYLVASSRIGYIRCRQWLVVHLNAARLLENGPRSLSKRIIAHLTSLHYLWKNPTDDLINEKLMSLNNFIDNDLAYLICERNKFLQEQNTYDESKVEMLRLQAKQGISNCEGCLVQSIVDGEFMKAQIVINLMFCYAQFLGIGDMASDKWRRHNVEILENVAQYYRNRRIGRWHGIEMPQLYEGSAAFQGIRYIKRAVRIG